MDAVGSAKPKTEVPLDSLVFFLSPAAPSHYGKSQLRNDGANFLKKLIAINVLLL